MPEVLFVCVHNAGRSQMAAALLESRPATASGCARQGASRPIAQSGRGRGDGRARHRHLAPSSRSSSRTGWSASRRRDHDGLRRRLPDLPGQALRGLGARRPGGQGPRDGAAHPRRDQSGSSLIGDSFSRRRSCAVTALPPPPPAARRVPRLRLPRRRRDRLGHRGREPVARRHRAAAVRERGRDRGRPVHDHPHVRAGLRRPLQPVVSLVDAHFGGLCWRDALAYIPAQIAGCITGAIVANVMFALARSASPTSTGRPRPTCSRR